MNQEIKDDSTPQVEMVSDEMVEAYCNAVHHYLGNLSQERWAEDRKDNYTAVRHVARIGLQAALNARAGGDYVPTVPDAVAVLANLRNQFEKLPIRREPMSGQTHSYVERDNVLALIEQAAENFSKPWPGIRDLCQPAALASQAVGVRS